MKTRYRTVVYGTHPSNGLSTLATVAEFGDCRQNRRQSPNSATVAVFGDSSRFRRQIVAEIGDYSFQCGQGLILQVAGRTVRHLWRETLF